MDSDELLLSPYQVAVIKQRILALKLAKADYTPDLTTEAAIRTSCSTLGAYDGQLELLELIVAEAENSDTTPEVN